MVIASAYYLDWKTRINLLVQILHIIPARHSLSLPHIRSISTIQGIVSASFVCRNCLYCRYPYTKRPVYTKHFSVTSPKDYLHRFIHCIIFTLTAASHSVRLQSRHGLDPVSVLLRLASTAWRTSAGVGSQPTPCVCPIVRHFRAWCFDKGYFRI